MSDIDDDEEGKSPSADVTAFAIYTVKSFLKSSNEEEQYHINITSKGNALG